MRKLVHFSINFNHPMIPLLQINLVFYSLRLHLLLGENLAVVVVQLLRLGIQLGKFLFQ
jgi:hypothetical protein